MNINHNPTYDSMICLENLFIAWSQFRKGKTKRYDVQLFERHLEDNIFRLHHVLDEKIYRHGSYHSFYVQDPKQRHIHKATVQDRVVHHLLYIYLYSLFDKSFIYDSYSCRLEKGTHKGVKRLECLVGKVSKNYTKECWVLQCDIKKFFANIDHTILLNLLEEKVHDENIIWLLQQVIESFYSSEGKNKGMPLGNLTSQIFSNIYLNELDQYVKHTLKVKYYLRYADDFIILSEDKEKLIYCIDLLRDFVKKGLKLEIHPQKITVRKLEWGIDFLGYIVLPHYVVPRTKTVKRMLKKLQEKIDEDNFEQSFQSYLGYLKHARSYKIIKKLKSTLIKLSI